MSDLTPLLRILVPLPISGCHLSVHPLWNLALQVPWEFTIHISTEGSNKFPLSPKCLINSCLLNVYFTSNLRGNRKDTKIQLSTSFLLPQLWCSFGTSKRHSASLLWACLVHWVSPVVLPVLTDITGTVPLSPLHQHLLKVVGCPCTQNWEQLEWHSSADSFAAKI